MDIGKLEIPVFFVRRDTDKWKLSWVFLNKSVDFFFPVVMDNWKSDWLGAIINEVPLRLNINPWSDDGKNLEVISSREMLTGTLWEFSRTGFDNPEFPVFFMEDDNAFEFGIIDAFEFVSSSAVFTDPQMRCKITVLGMVEHYIDLLLHAKGGVNESGNPLLIYDVPVLTVTSCEAKAWNL
jgi:hypothetical protein